MNPRGLLKVSLIAISILLNIKYLTNKLIYRPAPVPFNAFEASRSSEFRQLRIDSADIVFLGDSFTDLFEVGEFFGRLDIKNRGIAGDLTSGVLHRLGPVIDGHPKQLFLEVGINDLLKGITVDSAFANIQAITQAIAEGSPRTRIVIASILPANGNVGNTEQKVLPEIIALNDKLKKLAADSRLAYLDLYPDYLGNGGLAKAYDCGDGLHLNGAGYVLWKNELTPVLMQAR